MQKDTTPPSCVKCVYRLYNAAEKHQPAKQQDTRDRCRQRVHQCDDPEHNEEDSQCKEPSPPVMQTFEVSRQSRRAHTFLQHIRLIAIAVFGMAPYCEGSSVSTRLI